MVVFALISLFTALFSLFLGHYVLYLNHENTLNRLFYALSLGIFYWAFTEFGLRQAASYDAARVWLTILSFWPFTAAIGLHFILFFTEQKKLLKKHSTYLIIYLPAFVFSVVYFLMLPETYGPKEVYWGWTYNWPKGITISSFAHAWVVAIMIFTLTTCFRYYFNAKDTGKKYQSLYVLTGTTVSMSLGIASVIILPRIGIRPPELTTLGFFLANLFTGYAVWKYQLFMLTPITAVNDIISTIPDALFLVDGENRIRSVSPSALKILGYRKREIVDQPIGLVFSESDDLLEKIKKQRIINDAETLMITKDRKMISVSLTASVITGRSNVNFGLVFIARDITDRIQSINQLKESEDKFRGIAERSFDMIFTVDNEGKLTYVSPASETLFQYHPEEVIGQSFTKYVKPTVAQVMLDGYQKYSSGKDFGTQRMVVFKKDGSPATVEVNLSRIYNGNKQVGTQGIMRDVSDRIRSEKALMESEEKFKLIFENVNDALIYIDTELQIIEINPKTEELFGVERFQTIGKNMRDFLHMFHPVDFQNVVQFIKNTINGNTDQALQIPITNPNGLTIFVEGTARLIKKEDKFIGFVCIIRDITQRKRAEEEKNKLEKQLVRAQKMDALGTMASGVAHDFNNSLGSIILNTEVSLDEAPPNSELKHSLEQVLKASTRAKKLVHQILTFSRDEKVERRPLNISIVVNETLDMLRPMLSASIEINKKIDDDIHPVLADATQIQQLVMNLCSNSAHAMRDKGGKLKVKLENITYDMTHPKTTSGTSPGPGKYVKLVIQDNGHGIAHDIKDRVFDPFFTTKSKNEGTGLGLSVVHGIVAAHEGVIDLNTEVGKGTTFTIHFPIITNVPPKADPQKKTLPSGTESILFIDDESDFVDISKRMLSKLGYQVHGMTNAIEALTLFQEQHHQFDVVITDLTMPHMTGMEIAEAFLKIRPNIPIIICTGLNNSVKPEEMEKSGIKDCVMKPFIVREMAETLRRVLDETAN